MITDVFKQATKTFKYGQTGTLSLIVSGHVYFISLLTGVKFPINKTNVLGINATIEILERDIQWHTINTHDIKLIFECGLELLTEQQKNLFNYVAIDLDGQMFGYKHKPIFDKQYKVFYENRPNTTLFGREYFVTKFTNVAFEKFNPDELVLELDKEKTKDIEVDSTYSLQFHTSTGHITPLGKINKEALCEFLQTLHGGVTIIGNDFISYLKNDVLHFHARLEK